VPRAAIAITKAFVSLSTECSLRDYLVCFFFFRLIRDPRASSFHASRSFGFLSIRSSSCSPRGFLPVELSFADHWVRGRFAVKNSDRQIEWRWGALVPFIWLGNAHCMSQRRNSFNAKDDLCETMLVMKGEAGASRRSRHATACTTYSCLG
jgi:hypothetical protein